MSAAMSFREKRKNKIRFNFVDVLLLTALLVSLLAVFGGLLISFSSAEQDVVITLQLKAVDVERTAAMDVLLDEGTAVYRAQDDTLLGYLARDYRSGDESVALRVKATQRGSERMLEQTRLYIGQTMDLRSEGLLCYEAVINDLKEAVEYE